MKVLITIVPTGETYSISEVEIIAKLKGGYNVVAEEAISVLDDEAFTFVTTKDKTIHKELLAALKNYNANFNPLVVDANISRKGFWVIHVTADYQQIADFFDSINADITYFDESGNK